MSTETPDLSTYGQYFTRPMEARAIRLKEDKVYQITVNGVPDEVIGRAGDWDVYILNKKGKILHNEPYSQEAFDAKFGQKNAQGDLVFKEKDEKRGDEEDEDE